jgi:putative tricarboxylic transport membrane protein
MARSQESLSLTTLLSEGTSKTVHLRKSTGEAIVLVFLGVLGLFAMVYSQLYLPLENPFGAGVGPRLFPQLAGTVMMLMSVYLLSLLGWRRHRGTLEDEVMELDIDDHIRVVAVIVLVVGYMAVFNAAGFLLATSSVLFSIFVTLGYRHYIAAGGLALGLTLAIYALFDIALGMPLPAPILGGIL